MVLDDLYSRLARKCELYIYKTLIASVVNHISYVMNYVSLFVGGVLLVYFFLQDTLAAICIMDIFGRMLLDPTDT